MAIKFEFYRRCVKCEFEDDDNSPENVIWKVHLDFDDFRSKSYEYFWNTLNYYFVSPRDTCPCCNDNNIQFSISRYEYFRRTDDYIPQRMGNGVLIRRLDSDFSKCFLLNISTLNSLIEKKAVELRFNEYEELTLNINEGPMIGSWYYGLPSFSKCYDESSESFELEYVEFTSSNRTTFLHIEEKAFINLINLSHQLKPLEFTMESLLNVPLIERYIPMGDEDF